MRAHTSREAVTPEIVPWNYAAASVIAAVCVVGSLTPFRLRAVSIAVAAEYGQYALRYGTFFSPVDWLSNFLLFFPLAFFTTGVIDRDTHFLRTRVFRAALLWVALSIFSVGLELCQIWFAGRVPSPHDVMAQAIGAIIGICTWHLCGAAVSRWLWGNVRVFLGGGPQAALAKLYVIAVIGFSLFPLDLTLHPNELYQKWRAGHVTITPFADPTTVDELFLACLGQVLVYTPLGMLVKSDLLLHRRAPSPSLYVSMGLIPFVVEVMQFFALSRWASTTHALAGLVGLVGGGAAAVIIHRLLRRR